jgi:hypothetical protein
MRTRIAAIVTAIALLTGAAVPFAGAAVPQPTGPPLGYYYGAIRTCQKDSYQYYHNQSVYRACQQDKTIVENAGKTNWCYLITDAGIVASIYAKATGQLNGWAAVAIISGMNLACEL